MRTDSRIDPDTDPVLPSRIRAAFWMLAALLLLRPLAPAAAQGDSVVRVDMRQIVFAPAEIRVKAGQRVEWINSDPTVHTVTADDESWGSELIQEGGRFRHTFTAAGRFPYHCVPHPMMRGVVIVEGRCRHPIC